MSEQPEQKTTVLVVDDDRLLRRQLHWALVERHRVLEAETRADAVELLRRERVDVCICDLHLPPDLEGIEEGLAVVEAARNERPAVPVVVITGSINKQAALEAIRRGAYGFFEKPFDEEEVSHIGAQVKLLRVLQERKFERVGSNRMVEVDIRLIAASNRDLEQEVERNNFRRDLFYRLNVVPLCLPPLRARREDIPVLAAHFAAKAAAKYDRPVPELDPAFIEALQEDDWPGNVRELENLVEGRVLLTREPRLGVERLHENMQR